MKKSIFDLRDRTSLELERLKVGIETGIVECGDNPLLQELKEELIAWKMIVSSAKIIAKERESREWVDTQVKEINLATKYGLDRITYNWN